MINEKEAAYITSSASGHTPTEIVVPTRTMTKICGVCSDRAKSLHFGGMACDSCKAFFRRSVQNEAYKMFRCAYESKCHITISTRKSCQTCRFNKCVNIGMEKSWVMTEEERQQQCRLRQVKRQQKQHEGNAKEWQKMQMISCTCPNHSDSTNYAPLSAEDSKEIEILYQKFYHTYKENPPEFDLNSKFGKFSYNILNVFSKTIERLEHFSMSLSRFQSLCHKDQRILLNNGLLGMCILRGAAVFDSNMKNFMLKNTDRKCSGQKIHQGELKNVMSTELYKKQFKFIHNIKNLKLNETTLMILKMVVLFNADCSSLSDTYLVTKHQDFYIQLLRRYMQSFYGNDTTNFMFPKMLYQLVDLRVLTEEHNPATIMLPSVEIERLVNSFKTVDVYPYYLWNNDKQTAMNTNQRYPVVIKLPVSTMSPFKDEMLTSTDGDEIGKHSQEKRDEHREETQLTTYGPDEYADKNIIQMWINNYEKNENKYIKTTDVDPYIASQNKIKTEEPHTQQEAASYKSTPYSDIPTIFDMESKSKQPYASSFVTNMDVPSASSSHMDKNVSPPSAIIEETSPPAYGSTSSDFGYLMLGESSFQPETMYTTYTGEERTDHEPCAKAACTCTVCCPVEQPVYEERQQ